MQAADSNNCSTSLHTSHVCDGDIFYDVTTRVHTHLISAEVAPLISDKTKIIIEYVIHISLFYVTSCFGVIVNVINIIVYRKQGLKDSITLGLFALSISDLLVSGLPIETATCYALKNLFPDSAIQFVSYHYVHSSWTRRMFYSLSCLITTLLSLERCLCVIKPFKVKVIFTRSRTAIFIVCLFVFHIVCYVPIFATHRLRWQENPNPDKNGTKIFKVWFLPHREVIENFNSTLMAIITPTLAQVIVTGCAAVMIKGLREASRFRQAVTTTTTTTNTTNNTTNTPTTDSTTTTTTTSPKADDKMAASNKLPPPPPTALSPRDARLVRTMVLLVAILSACNIPYLVMTYSLLAVPRLNIGRPYENTYSLIFSITYLLSTTNASLNVFIYYNTSTKYRDIFRQVFCRGKKA